MAQQPKEHVEHDHRPGIADMGEVIDRRTADIDAAQRGIDRFERLLRRVSVLYRRSDIERLVLMRDGAERRRPGPAG